MSTETIYPPAGERRQKRQRQPSLSVDGNGNIRRGDKLGRGKEAAECTNVDVRTVVVDVRATGLVQVRFGV